jgi:hypothetical protein
MFVARWYTRASRVRIVVAKFDGRWKLPGGPYPIPELAAVVGGILLTLLLLPRVGQPVPTGIAGIVATVLSVGVMRKMPYSPVKFSTRVHRVIRLYTSPISLSSDDDRHTMNPVSTVRPQIEVIDVVAQPTAAPTSASGKVDESLFAPVVDPETSPDRSGPHNTTAVDLFS